ncbi:hypothetical protein EDB19DRAFT_1836418 [Suillus lakei]|nr:hypothetical protein EDB19DRAFT_1836418 [Suillus lakei]
MGMSHIIHLLASTGPMGLADLVLQAWLVTFYRHVLYYSPTGQYWSYRPGRSHSTGMSHIIHLLASTGPMGLADLILWYWSYKPGRSYSTGMSHIAYILASTGPTGLLYRAGRPQSMVLVQGSGQSHSMGMSHITYTLASTSPMGLADQYIETLGLDLLLRCWPVLASTGSTWLAGHPTTPSSQLGDHYCLYMMFRPGLAQKPRLWPGFRWLRLAKNPGQAKAASDGRLWPGSGLSRGPSTVNAKLQEQESVTRWEFNHASTLER